jgi:outer membrane protein
MGRLAMAAVVGVALLCGSHTSWADGEPPLQLTPQKVAQMTLENSLQVQIDAQSLEQALAQLRQIYTAEGLRVTVQASHVRMGPVTSFSIKTDTGTENISVGNDTQTTVTLNAVKPLSTGKQVQRQAEVAKAGIQATRDQQAITRLALARTAQELSYGLLRMMRLAEVSQALVVANEEHLRIANAMFEAGTAARFEVVQAETELEKARGQVINALTGIELAKAVIRQVLVIPQTQPLDIVEGAPQEPVAGDLPALINEALESRPEIAAAQSRVAGAQSGVQLARATNNLQVDLAGQASHSAESSAFTSPTSWSLALQFSKPLVDGGLEQSLVDQAAARLKAARLSEEATRQAVGLDVAQQYVSVIQATSAIKVAEQGLASAEERLRIAKVRFSAGAGTGLEVIDAQTAWAAARATLVNARYDLETAVMKLRNSLAMTPAKEEQK